LREPSEAVVTRCSMQQVSGILATLLVCGAALAQSPVGSISGVVKDPSGAIIPGATVNATSLADGAKRTVSTNDQGFFLIPTLLPGDYGLVIESKGFKNYEVRRVGVEVGQTARVDANMSVAGDTVAIEVAGGDVAGVDTQQAVVGGVVNTRQIAELPLNGRNY